MVGFLRCLIYCQAVLVGLCLIQLAADPSWLDWVLDRCVDYFGSDHALSARVVLAAAGALHLLAVGALFVHWMHRHRYSREVTYQTEHGRISVSLLAIEEALSRAVENEPGVRKVYVRVREDRVRRCIVIEANLTLWEMSSVSEQNRRCQDIIRQRFAELMPEKTVVQIELNVSRLKHRYDSDAFVPVAEALTRQRTRLTEMPETANSLTPGLAATHGQVDNIAGAALLAQARHVPRPKATDATPAATPLVEDPQTSDQTQLTEGAQVVAAVRRLQAEQHPGEDMQARNAVQKRYKDLTKQGKEPPLEASTSMPAGEDDRRSTEPTATNTLGETGEEVFNDLYFGPTYPVVQDGQEPDYSGSALPADMPPSRTYDRDR